MRSDTMGDVSGLVVENNYFVEGEIGVSLGGNTSDPFRFTSSMIRRNVLSDIGRSQPTGRTLAWGIELTDNDGATIQDNLLLDQDTPGVGNAYAIRIGGGTERDVSVETNLFYRIQTHALIARPDSGHESITVSNNRFVDPDQGSCLVDHSGAFDAYTYSGNTYFSSADAAAWFCLNGSTVALSDWQSASGEADATALASPPSFAEPDRSVETYAGTIGVGSTLPDFLAVARLQSRLTWRDDLTAPALNDYIRAGFE